VCNSSRASEEREKATVSNTELVTCCDTSQFSRKLHPPSGFGQWIIPV